MKQDELDEVIRLHALWLTGDEGGARADLSGAYLHGAYLREANLSGAYLHGAYLREANLSGAYLRGANLTIANLHEANLRGADLYGANLIRANLEGAYLLEAGLRRANLEGANLELAILIGANLEGASLRRANLEGASLRRANLEGANLGQAYLSDIKNKTIFTFSSGRHSGYYCDGLITIGCESHNVKHWLDNYQEIGKSNDYSDSQIEVYGNIIKFIADTYCEDTDDCDA